MKTLIAAAALVAIWASTAIAGDEFVQPERATAVLVSNRDVNRIHCPIGVTDVIWSAEKPVKVTKTPENVFVKFLVARQGERQMLVTDPLDVHVVCGKDVYTMILHPREMDSVTVRLGGGTQAKVAAARRDLGAESVEDQIKRLTLAVYRNDIPDSYQRKSIQPGDPRRTLSLFMNADVIGQSEVVAPGTGLKAVEYVVYANEPVQLQERDFLVPQLGEVVGITVEPLNLKKDEVARLIVIERSALTEVSP